MAEEVVYNVRLFPSSKDSLPKASRKRPQLNIRLRLREVMLIKTSDETPLQDDQEMDVCDALKLWDDGFAEMVNDISPPEIFKSFSLSLQAYFQKFEFYKALSDMGLGGNSYTDLRDELVKKFEAFADSLCKRCGPTRPCSFTADLFVMNINFVCHEPEADMSRTGSSNSGDAPVNDEDEECNSSSGSNSFK